MMFMLSTRFIAIRRSGTVTAAMVVLLNISITGYVNSSEKRFLTDDGVDVNDKILQMEREMQILKANILELQQNSGSCNCGSEGGNGNNNGNGGPTYIRWGRKDCPANDTELVYTGMAGGGYYNYYGSAAEYVCLPMIPDILPGPEKLGTVPTFIYGAEYEDTYFKESKDDDVPCAVCMPKQTRAVIMIPGKSKCYPGWKMEYFGRLASGHHTQKAATQYVCVDSSPQTFDAGNADMNGKLFYAVEAACGSLRCPPYKPNEKLPCVVCSK